MNKIATDYHCLADITTIKSLLKKTLSRTNIYNIKNCRVKKIFLNEEK